MATLLGSCALLCALFGLWQFLFPKSAPTLSLFLGFSETRSYREQEARYDRSLDEEPADSWIQLKGLAWFVGGLALAFLFHACAQGGR